MSSFDPQYRFLAKVDRHGPNDCWNWMACLNTDGYGSFYLEGKTMHASRAAYLLFVGPADGVSVLHRCDNPKCVNPKHLWIGTQKDNIHDMHAKGRDYNGKDLVTDCPSGHAYTLENTRIYRNKRICRQCDRKRNRNNPQRTEAARLRAATSRRRA